MRKLVVLASLVAAIAASALVVGAGGAGADPGNGNGAVVQRDPYGTPHTCFVVDTHGGFWTFDCAIHIVTTPNGDVKEFLDGPITFGDAPATAVRDVTTAETGLLCDFVDGVFTNITEGTVTPGGQVHLTCRS
jgi:hypothetical protein